MSEIIDSLIIQLGLDSKGVTKGAAEATQGLKSVQKEVDKTQKESVKTAKVENEAARLRKQTDQAATKTAQERLKAEKESQQGFKDTAESMLRFLGVAASAVAIKAFVVDTINTNSSLGRLATNLDTSVPKISAWGQVVEQSGGDAKELQGTLNMLSSEQMKFKTTGTSGLIPFFSMLGVQLTGIGPKFRDSTDQLHDLSVAFHRMIDSGKMTREGANRLGISMGVDQGTMNVLLDNKTAKLDALLADALSKTAATQAQADAAERTKIKLERLSQKSGAFGRKVVAAAEPLIDTSLDVALDPLSKITGFLKKTLNWVTQGSNSVSPAEVSAFFQSKGWSKEQAAGLTARIMRESFGDASRPQANGGPGYGLLQWEAPRQANFKKWAGHDIHQSTYQEQLEFIQYELTRGQEIAAGRRLRGARTADEAGRDISLFYARPAAKVEEALATGITASALAGVPSASRLAAGATPQSVSTNSSVHIGEIKIITAATDPKAIAETIKPHISNVAHRANTGMQ